MAEYRCGQHNDDPETLHRSLEQLEEEFRDVNKLKVHARRDEIPDIQVWVRAWVKNRKIFRVWESFVLHHYPAYMAFGRT